PGQRTCGHQHDGGAAGVCPAPCRLHEGGLDAPGPAHHRLPARERPRWGAALRLLSAQRPAAGIAADPHRKHRAERTEPRIDAGKPTKPVIATPAKAGGSNRAGIVHFPRNEEGPRHHYRHSRSLAILAPSRSAANFAQITVGCTSVWYVACDE